MLQTEQRVEWSLGLIDPPVTFVLKDLAPAKGSQRANPVDCLCEMGVEWRFGFDVEQPHLSRGSEVDALNYDECDYQERESDGHVLANNTKYNQTHQRECNICWRGVSNRFKSGMGSRGHSQATVLTTQTGSFMSIRSMSWLNRLVMIPTSVVWKKLHGAFKVAFSRSVCRFNAVSLMMWINKSLEILELVTSLSHFSRIETHTQPTKQATIPTTVNPV